jgi:hypothetical protein
MEGGGPKREPRPGMRTALAEGEILHKNTNKINALRDEDTARSRVFIAVSTRRPRS